MAPDDRSVTRRRFLTAAGGAAAVTLAGCTGGGGQDTATTTTASDDGEDTTTTTSDDGGDEQMQLLTYARGNDSGTLDPQNTTSGEDVKVTNQAYDTLIRFKPGETSLTQGLATSWNLSGTTATLTLREGVTFHNGEEFTAADFIATFRRFTDPEYEHYPGDDYVSVYGGFTLGSWIESIETDGDYSMTLDLSQQYAPFLRNLAMFAAAVHSEAAIQELGQDLSGEMVGTGPFQFVNWDTSNQRIRLEANDEYWGQVPSVDEVVFTAIGQNTTRAQTLASGDADVIDGLGAQSSKIVDGSDAAELLSIPGINVGYLAMNMAKFEPFRDRRVRQAVSYAINTEAIVNTIFQGIAEQASQPIPSSVLGYNEELDPYPYDPEMAQSLLAEAGHGDGFGFELATFQNPRTYNPSPVSAAQTVKSNLSEVGVEVEINQQPFNPFLEYTSAGKHDACFLGWMTDNADPDNFFYALLDPQLPTEDLPDGQDWVDAWDNSDYNTLNVASWANSEYIDLVREAQRTYDSGTRAENYRQAAKIAHDEAPWVFMDHAQELRGVHSRVSGFVVAPISGPFLNRVSIEM